MRRFGITIGFILLGLLLCSTLQPVSADGDGIRTEPLLEMTEPSDAVKLSAFAANGSIECGSDACDMVMEQTYWLHNESLDAIAALQVGLTKGASEWEVEQISLTQDGSALTSSEANEFFAAIWQVRLQPNQHATLVVRYKHTLGSDAVIAASVELNRIVTRWGTPEGARVRFTLSDTVGDDAILWMVPFISQFDGQQVAWDYEVPRELISHQLALIRPDVWRDIKDSTARQDSRKLAALYLQVDEGLQPLGLAERDYFGQALAAYTQAIAQEPNNPELYVELAQAYHIRAGEQSAEGQNYELLATQALEHAYQLAPSDALVAQQLAQSYYAVAVASANQGQQETALNYLEKLRTSGLPAVESDEMLLTLALRWSVELAEKGYNQVAFDQAQKLLPEATLQMLSEFAPPFTGLETRVEMDGGTRMVTYHMQLYPGTAQRTAAEVEEILERLQGIPGLEITNQPAADSTTITLKLAFNTLSELQQVMSTLSEAIGQENDLLTAALRAPWKSAPEALEQSRAGIKHSLYFREVFNTSSLQPIWEEQSQYAQWRLVEMTNQSEDGELEQLQKRLITILLKQQQRIWRQIPAGCSWEYHISLSTAEASGQEWLISWGEDRTLEIDQTYYNQPVLTGLAIASVVVVILAILALLFPWGALRK